MAVTALEPLFIYASHLRLIYSHLQHSPDSSVYTKYRRLKQRIGKQQHQHITVEEFSEYVGLDKEIVLQRIK